MAPIRRAVPSEADALSDLAFRSKASWGYSTDFMAACRDALTIRSDAIAHDPVYVLENGGQAVGFYHIVSAPPNGVLADLWIAPGSQRQGLGRRLFEHALKTAATSGYDELIVESDPNAESFYLAMGARRVGANPSPMGGGRQLPVFTIRLR